MVSTFQKEGLGGAHTDNVLHNNKVLPSMTRYFTCVLITMYKYVPEGKH